MVNTCQSLKSGRGAHRACLLHDVSALQVGKLLAELVREPVAPGAAGSSSSRREGNTGAEGAAPGVASGELLYAEWSPSAPRYLLVSARLEARAHMHCMPCSW